MIILGNKHKTYYPEGAGSNFINQNLHELFVMNKYVYDKDAIDNLQGTMFDLYRRLNNFLRENNFESDILKVGGNSLALRYEPKNLLGFLLLYIYDRSHDSK